MNLGPTRGPSRRWKQQDTSGQPNCRRQMAVWGNSFKGRPRDGGSQLLLWANVGDRSVWNGLGAVLPVNRKANRRWGLQRTLLFPVNKPRFMTKDEIIKKHKPIFMIEDEDYYLGQWTFHMPFANVMAFAWRTPDGVWHVRWRFRIILDDKRLNPDGTTDSEDIKHVHDLIPPAPITEEEVFTFCDGLFGRMARQVGASLEFIECRCKGKALAEKMLSYPRPDMQVATPRHNASEEEKTE